MLDHICDSTSQVGRIVPRSTRITRWEPRTAYDRDRLERLIGIAGMLKQAREEALRRPNQAVEDLNTLGLNYRLATGNGTRWK
jgi:hypothetical protein